MSRPNGYDRSFIRWFRDHGWLIHSGFWDIEVWSHDETRCPFRINLRMINRLLEAGLIEQSFRPGCIWDEWYQ